MGDDKEIKLNCPKISKFPKMKVKCSGVSRTETTNTFV